MMIMMCAAVEIASTDMLWNNGVTRPYHSLHFPRPFLLSHCRIPGQQIEQHGRKVESLLEVLPICGFIALAKVNAAQKHFPETSNERRQQTQADPHEPVGDAHFLR